MRQRCPVLESASIKMTVPLLSSVFLLFISRNHSKKRRTAWRLGDDGCLPPGAGAADFMVAALRLRFRCLLAFYWRLGVQYTLTGNQVSSRRRLFIVQQHVYLQQRSKDGASIRYPIYPR